MTANPTTLTKKYYTALDDKNYDELAEIISRNFQHKRPDKTLEARDFIEFMKNERPLKDTTHELNTVYQAEPNQVAVEGALKHQNEVLFRFIDAFTIEDNRIQEIRTYTR